MILDALNKFSDAQSLATSAAAGIKSTNSIPLGVARDVGNGRPLYVVITVTTTLAGPSSDDVHVDLITDDNEGLNSAATVRRLCTIPDNSVAGTQIIVALPIEGSEAYQSYIGLLYTADDTDLTAGAVSAAITLDPDKFKSYANGFDIATS